MSASISKDRVAGMQLTKDDDDWETEDDDVEVGDAVAKAHEMVSYLHSSLYLPLFYRVGRKYNNWGKVRWL